LLYLSDQEDDTAGGETSFPLAQTGKTTDGVPGKTTDGEAIPLFKIHPGKGSAVLFYNLLPDGNGDVRSLHAALPVLKGEKWLANLWVRIQTFYCANYFLCCALLSVIHINEQNSPKKLYFKPFFEYFSIFC